MSEKKLCECGCGGFVTKPGNRFIHGHHRRGKKHSDITREKMSKTQKKLWKNPLTHEKASNAQKKRFKENPVSDETHEKMVISQKKRWDDPLEHEKASEARKKYFEDPLAHEKVSQNTKKQFKDPLAREKHSKIQKKRFKENPVSDETREKHSKATKKRYEDPLEREKTAELTRKRYENPLEREKQSKIMKEYWKTLSQREERCKRISAGKQHIPYDEWEEFACEQLYCPDYNEKCKESNREKYGRMCFLTGLPEKENIDKNGKQKKLSVHHYDMDKGQGCDGKKWKLVPLCMGWHSKVHNKLWEARIIWLLDNVWN